MSLVPALLQAIVTTDGEALVLHVGEKPYVVTPTGQVDLATRGLTFDAVNGIVNEILPRESQNALDEFGAVQYELPSIVEFPGEQFTIVAARGGDDLWAEIRRRTIPDEDHVPIETFAPPSPAAMSGAAARAVDDDLEIPGRGQLWPAQAAGARTEPAAEAPAPKAAASVPGPPAAPPRTASRPPLADAKPAPVAARPALPLIPPPPRDATAAAVDNVTAQLQGVTPPAAPPRPASAAIPPAPLPIPTPVDMPPAARVEPSPPVRVEPSPPVRVEPPPPARVEPPPPVRVESPQPVRVERPPPVRVEPPSPVRVEPPPPVRIEPPPAMQVPSVRPAAPEVPATPVVPQPVSVAPKVVPAPPRPEPRVTPPLPQPVAPPVAAPPPIQWPAAIVAPSLLYAPPPVTLPVESPVGVVQPIARNPIRPDVPAPLTADALAGLDKLLRLAAARGASSLYLSSASRPTLRVDGDIQSIDGAPVLGPNDVEALLLTLMPERNAEALRTGVASEWICDVPEVGRVRCMTFRDHRGPGGVFRMMPLRTVTAEQLNLSRQIQGLAIEPEGLVLVAGPRQSGKRTLMSALVDLINRTRRDHVITVETEINVLHDRVGSFVSQREVRGGRDEMLATAREALREDPDVLVLEDIRTAGLMNLALDAAASGQLVIGGLPAHNASSAIDRIIDLYPPEYRRQIQLSLAQNLRGVVAQVLLRKITGGRVAARELMLNTPAVRGVLAEGRTSQLPLAIEGGRPYGMVPLNDALVGFVQSGAVDVREAYWRAADRAGFLALLKRQGLDTSAIDRPA